MKSTRRSRKGSVLISVIVVLMLAAMAALALTLTLQDYARMEVRSRDELQAFYAAEAGALEVVSWFNTSGTAVADLAPALASLFQRNDDGEYEALEAALSGDGIDVGCDFDEDLLPVLRDAASSEVARVSSLKLLPPTPQQLAQIPGLICIVRSDGVSRRGGHKTVYFFLAFHRMEIDGAPAAIVSRAAAAFYGNVKAHWGEVWAQGNLAIPNRSQVPTQDEDPWLKFRTEGKLEFPANWNVPRWGKPWHPGTQGDIVDGTDQPCLGVARAGIGDNYGEMMWQNQSLDWPDYDYDEMKRLAQQKGRYYSTDAAGNVYRDGIEDADHLVTDLVSELSVEGDRDDWDNVDYDVVFIDTIDGNPPAADGSNLTTLRLSGAGASWKGFYYICANLNVSGMGQPSPIPIKDPDDNYELHNIFMDGILCVAGWYEGSGNEEIYGSLYAERGFHGTGTPNVYYNVDLRDGFPAPIRSSVELILWKVEN